jgi:carbon-monoxide dehydrogenase medium subunit
MIPASFEYEVAGSVAEAVELLGQREDAKLLAGGHSLLPAMKLRIARPATLVDIGRIGDLSYVREDGDAIAIGALTRHHDLATSDLLNASCGIVAHTAGLIGDPQVRHRGTIGGSVAHGDPASDLPAVLLALDAELVARGRSGERVLSASEFFRGFLETALEPDELLTEIRVPTPGPDGYDYQKFNRRAQDWAIVGSLAVRVDGHTNVALVNMAPTPLRAIAVEQALASGASVVDAAAQAAEGTEAMGDVNASVEYREHLARVLTRRALEAAARP